MKRCSILLLTLATVSSSFAQTIVSGEVSGVWSKDNSPYIVEGDILVPTGQALTIDPGVEIKFDGSFQFGVEGLLLAIGTQGDSIVFTTNHSDSTWRGLRFNEANDNSRLDFVKIEQGYADGSFSPEGRGGGVYCYRTHLSIGNSLIRNNMADSYGGGVYINEGSARILNTTIANNRSDFYGGGVAVTNSNDVVLMANSRMLDNEAGSSGSAISIYNESQVLLYQILITGNRDARFIMEIRNSNLRLESCVLYSNESNQIFEDFAVGDASVDILNSIVFQSGDIFPNSLFRVDISHSNIEGGAEGTGNIDADPLFVDPSNGDFHLQGNSPSLNTGHPSAFFNDLDGTRNDMGIYGGSGISLSPPGEVDFGPTGQGQQKSQNLFFYNLRETAVNLTASALSDQIDFSTDFTAPMVIPPNAADSVLISFHPTATGQFNEQIEFESPDLINAASASVDLLGYGGVWSGDVSGVWRASDSPFIIGGDIRVPYEETLIIEPGVEVQVDTTFAGSDVKFIVEGSLFAEGANGNPIIFTTIPGQEVPGSWGGLHLLLRSTGNSSPGSLVADALKKNATGTISRAVNATEGSSEVDSEVLTKGAVDNMAQAITQLATPVARLEYCEVKFAKTGITAEHDSVTIQHCTISDNSEHGIRWHGDERSASGKVRNSTIQNNGGWGIYCYAFCYTRYGTASPTISGNAILSNSQGGIYLYAYGGSPFSWTGFGDDVDRATVSPTIKNNQILENKGEGISGYSRGDWTDGIPFDHWSVAYTEPHIANNIMAGNSSGIETTMRVFDAGRRISYSEFHIDHVTTWMNGDTLLYASDSTEVSIGNSILWEIGASGLQIDGGTLLVTYSDVQGGYSGEGNIDLDPLFVDPAGGDFSLQENSPAIDAGDPNSPLDPDMSRADMGAIPFLQIPPTISYSPDSIDVVLESGDSTNAIIQVTNVGQVDLSYIVSAHPVLGQSPFLLSHQGYPQHYYENISKGGIDLRQGRPVISGSGGPDNFGHTWIDSDETGGPAFDWIDIANIGTQIVGLGDDTNVGPFNIGFNFPFYGNSFSTFRLCSNGFITFTSTSATFGNRPLPSSGSPSNIIAPFWDDLDFNSGGKAYYHFDGSKMIIQYDNVPHIYFAGGPYSFELLLYPNGDILFQYLTMGSPVTSATVGIQNNNGTDGLEIAFNSSYIHDELAIYIGRRGLLDWISFDPESGQLEQDNSVAIGVKLNTRTSNTILAPGEYQANLIIASNDPANSQVSIPMQMRASGHPPVPASPLDDAAGVPINPSLTWNPSEGASSYELQISTSSDFSLLIIDQTEIADTAYFASNLELAYDTDYYWRVRAVHAGINSQYSDVWRFRTNIAPPLPAILISPGDEAANVDTSITIQWRMSAAADSYEVQISTSVDFDVLFIQESVTSDTSLEISGLSNSTRYYWRIAAINAGGVTYSETWGFTTIVADPTIPILSTPESGAGGVARTPLLTWGEVAEADSYRVEIAEDVDFNQIVLSIGGITAHSLELEMELTFNQTYYWRVQAINAAGMAASEVWHFTTVVEPPGSAVLSYPDNDATSIPIEMALQWRSVAYADSFSLELGITEDLSNLIIHRTGITDTMVQVTGLSHEATYYWRIESVNSGGSAYSETWSFTTVISPPSAPQLIFPTNGHQGVSLNPTLSWRALATADSYTVELARGPDFNSTLIVEDWTAQASYALVDTLELNTLYYWRIQALNIGGATYSDVNTFFTAISTSVDQVSGVIPLSFELLQNYPNPFNPSTTIEFALPKREEVVLKIYDLSGREIATVVDDVLPMGKYKAVWDATGLASGIYLYRIKAGGYMETRKLSFVK